MSGATTGVLRAEHELLGAEFERAERATPPAVLAYPHEEVDGAGALLADLTGATYLLVSGADAGRFARAALAGRLLDVGEAAHEAALSGTGELISVPLLVRTGDTEVVVIDALDASGALAAWLALLGDAGADEGRAAFPDLSLRDASDLLVPLMLAGPRARAVLEDYVHGDDALPGPGEVRQLRLDAITAVVAHPAAPVEPSAYLILVPVPAARVLWRSLLSFTEVEPVGHRTLRSLLARRLPWRARLAEGAPARVSRSELEGWGIVRGDGSFVGGRALT